MENKHYAKDEGGRMLEIDLRRIGLESKVRQTPIQS